MKTTDNYPKRFLLYSRSRCLKDLYQQVVSLEKTVSFKASPLRHDQNGHYCRVGGDATTDHLAASHLQPQKPVMSPLDIRDNSVKSFLLMPIIAETKVINLKRKKER